jgi:hypothetical protein
VVKISYTGKLFQNNSEDITIHYGFGPDWENSKDEKMIKTELGYQIEIELLDKETFNFCIKNENDEWDNNDGANYIFNIEKPELALITLDDLSPARKHLRKTYLWSKKIRIAVYKLLHSIPKILTGNYKKKAKEE